ncbi:hypothetical protein SAMN05428962_5283 [Paenibacillus sp. BC26]|nr:hypothetical protein SAMN05428962_5283 [Paenibacillus sp. BC26]
MNKMLNPVVPQINNKKDLAESPMTSLLGLCL